MEISNRKKPFLSSKLESTSGRRHKTSRDVSCLHCDRFLSIKTYKKHEKLYYDRRESRWNKKNPQDDENGKVIYMFSAKVNRFGSNNIILYIQPRLY